MGKVANWHISKLMVWLVMGVLVLTGCSAQPQVQQGTLTNEVVLSAANPVGQTFVARYDGLSGIYFTLSPGEPGDGTIRLHLRADAQASEDLAISYEAIPVTSVTGPLVQSFFVPAQAASNQQYYYAFLEVTGSGSVEVGSGPGDSYLDGALYQNHAPQDAQAVFQLSYSRRAAALGLAQEIVGWGGVLLASLFLFVLPGWGILSVLLPVWDERSWAEKAGLSAGLSLALYPLLFLWTHLIGLNLGSAYAWMLPLLGGYLLAWRHRDRLRLIRPRLPTISWKNLHAKISHPQFLWPDLTLLFLLALIIFTRFWAIRSLEAPMWGDGYQHTIIAQLLVDNNGLFNSWQPYAELTTFTYHFGFHSAVAVFHWLTGIDVIHATLWVGQILNVLAVLVLYPLAVRVAGGSRWAGVVAVLVAGLLSPMPMFYVNWGRYTQLAGQVVLPVAVWLGWEGINQRATLKTFMASAIALAGVGLNHYRILIFMIPFFVMVWLDETLACRSSRPTRQLFWTGSMASLLFLPWFVHLFQGKILSFFGMQLATPASNVAVEMMQYNNGIGDLSQYFAPQIWLLFLLTLAWGFWRRERNSRIFFISWLLIYLEANPYLVSLPGTGAISNFTVLLAAYIPVSISLGSAAAWLFTTIGEQTASWRSGLRTALSFTMVIFMISLVWANSRWEIAQPRNYALVTHPDLLAARWMQNQLPDEAKILVNAFKAYSGTVVVGSDAGWWLPLLAHRATTLPPLNYTNEQTVTTDLRTDLIARYEAVLNNPLDTNLAKSLRQQGITHIFIGQRQGIVNASGVALSVQTLIESTHAQLQYHQDRVWVFSIEP
jgi:hypothetical protein